MTQPIGPSVEASCKGKATFAGKLLADAAAKRTRRNHESAKLMPYRCRYCGHWHLGEHIMSRGKSPEGQFRRERMQAAEAGE